MEIFSEELIKINYYALDKKSCLTEMCEDLFKKGIITSTDEFLDSILEREKLMSTGIGKAVAIPHSRSKSVQEFKILVYILQNDLEFDSIDAVPVRIIFMIAVPEELKQKYTRILSLISNFFRNEKNREDILNCLTGEEVYNILRGLNDEI